MPITNIRNLERALEILLSHKAELDRFTIENSFLYNLIGIRKRDESKDNLKKLLIFAPHWKGGPRPSARDIKRILAEFDEKYEIIIQKVHDEPPSQDVADLIYEQLIYDPKHNGGIKGLGPKIVATYLRDIIYHFGVWTPLTNYLYLPVDRHIQALFIKRLQIFDRHEVPGVSEPFSTTKNQAFQRALAQVHQPRVEFDYLWHIGSQFCSYMLCPICWIRDFCKQKKIEDQQLPI